MPPYKDVPANRLVTVQAGVQLLDTTATAFLAARDAYAEEEHHNLTIALPAGGYRSHAMDVDMHARPWLYNISDGIGLLPIDWSVHRTGKCIDIANGLDWMIANGHRWNFTRPLAFDHNHFQHDPTKPASTGGTPTTTEKDEDEEMKPYLINDGAAWYLCVPGSKMIHIDGPAALDAIQRMLDGQQNFNLPQVQAIERHWVRIPA